MGLHHRHTHGRVLRGLEAREQLEMLKRDSHGSNIKMNIPEGFAEKDNAQSAVSVVYVTLPQTFSGPAMFETLTAAPNPSPVATHTELDDLPNPTTAATQGSSQTISSAQVTETAKTHDISGLTTLVTATSPLTSSQPTAILMGTPLQATGSPQDSSSGNTDSSDVTSLSSASPSPTSSPSSGLSGGATAGLVIGILLAIAMAGALIFFCWRKQKKQHQEEILDEKHASFADAGARRVEAGANRNSAMSDRVPPSVRSSRTTSTAPRLSLRPVTQFLPNLAEQPKSTGKSLDVAAAGFGEKPKSAWERQASSGPKQNPFDDAPVLSEKQAGPESAPSNPFDESSDAPRTAALVAAAKASPENVEPAKGPKMGPGAAAPMSTAAAAAGAAGPSPPRGPNNVHRVQLDFKPSMDDELELRSGQLVRMLHEYDDGWALCIRMDRSQQGVVPRTCLSKLPVKPRPQGPPPGSRPPQGAGPGPRGPMPPGGNSNGPMHPRPLTPTQSSRSPSPQEGHGETPGAPSNVPARKPVPGQAM